MIRRRGHETPQARVRPDDRRVRVGAEELAHRAQVDRLASARRQHRVDVAVDDRHEAHLGSEVEHPVERGVPQTGAVAEDLGAHELLVDGELADAREHPRIEREHPPDVVRAVHVRRVEAGDHRVEAGLLLRRQRPVLLRDHRVDERVVVERRVRMQVVVRRPVARLEVVPLLLQRDAEHGRAPHPVAHDAEHVLQRDPPLDVVRQVEVDVVKGGPLRRRLGAGSRRGEPETGEQQNRGGRFRQIGHGRLSKRQRSRHEASSAAGAATRGPPGGGSPGAPAAGRVQQPPPPREAGARADDAAIRSCPRAPASAAMPRTLTRHPSVSLRIAPLQMMDSARQNRIALSFAPSPAPPSPPACRPRPASG